MISHSAPNRENSLDLKINDVSFSLVPIITSRTNYLNNEHFTVYFSLALNLKYLNS